jgi:hypothetical protein
MGDLFGWRYLGRGGVCCDSFGFPRRLQAKAGFSCIILRAPSFSRPYSLSPDLHSLEASCSVQNTAGHHRSRGLLGFPAQLFLRGYPKSFVLIASG